MLIAAMIACHLVQGVPARVVVMDATLGGNPYGKVTYMRGIVPGKGMERRTTLEVDDATGKYSVSEHRTYSAGGVPTGLTRTVVKGGRTIKVSLKYVGLTAHVNFSEGAEVETETFALEQDGATTTDASQFWFFGSAPAVNAKSTFWEYSLDDGKWLERVVTYAGTAKLKVGDKTVDAFRISVGKDVNFYVDEFGMPYKSVEETPAGTLTLVRTVPPPEGSP